MLVPKGPSFLSPHLASSPRVCALSPQPQPLPQRAGDSDGLLDLGVLALDAGLHDGGVAEDEDCGGTDEPEEGAEWGGDPEHGDADHEEAGVEGLLRDDVFADLDWVGRCGVGRAA